MLSTFGLLPPQKAEGSDPGGRRGIELGIASPERAQVCSTDQLKEIIMGMFDSRKSKKMRRRVSQAKRKARLARRAEAVRAERAKK